LDETRVDSQILMGPGDVCTLLDIKESTLRKYALLLTDAGYQFHVNEKGQRGYFNEDVVVLKKFLEIKNNSDMTLKQSANAVMSWVNQSSMSLSVTRKEDEKDRYSDDIKELKETVNNQTELIKQLVERLDEQQKHNAERDRRLEERDRNLMEVMNKTLETRKELLEIAAAKEENEKKGFFARLFKINQNK